MIKYTLVCDYPHSFEGWFRNSEDFEAQCDRKLVVCPICGSTDVKKGLMAPAVSTSRKRKTTIAADQMSEAAQSSKATNEGAAPADNQKKPAPSQQVMQPSALLPNDVQQKELIEALRLVRDRVVETSENVGSNFASEARKIHYGEAEERSIYGQTSPEDAVDLLEEGISVFPLPELPDDKN